jgi:hypothetical protein
VRIGSCRKRGFANIAAIAGVLPLAHQLPAQAVRDSAGARIVGNTGPALTGTRAWRIQPTPSVRIGGASADADTLGELQLVMGITRMNDGRYAVGVQASHAVRFYDARGRFLGFAGRKGQGPGEFQQIMGVRRLRGDSLFVTDLGEVEVFASDGKFAGQGASRARGDRFVYPTVVFSDGSYVGSLFDDVSIADAGRRRRQLPIVRVSRDGTQIDTIGSLPGDELVFDGRSRASFGVSVVFSGSGQLAGDDGRLFVASPVRAEIAQLDLTGKLIRIIRLPERSERVTDEMIREYREWVQAMPGEDGRPMPPAMKERFSQMLERVVYADRLPSFGRLLVDGAQNLWAQHYDFRSVFRTPGPVRTQTMTVPSIWDVLDPNGRWLCTVSLPARFTPVEIGSDYVAGLARDEDDVEQVRVYRLIKP